MRNSNVKKGSITKHGMALGAMFGLVLGMVSLPALAGPHKPNASTDVPVKMVVTVKARHDGEVPVVAKADVQVYQRNKQDMVASWVPLQGDRAGLQFFILIDDSARDALALQFSSIAKFIDEQPASTSIGIGYMHNGMVSVSQELTTDHALAQKGLRLPIGIAAAGAPSPYLALSDLMKKWPETADRREILMFTSGSDILGRGFSEDPYNNPYLDEAVNRAQRGGFIIYSIYTPTSGFGGRGAFRTNLSQTALDILSQKTGGETYYLGFGAPVDINPYLADVSYDLKHQYELTFMAKGANKPSLEPVKVKTEMPNMGLKSAESGYVGSGT
jgi:hypothetical protein